MLTHLRKLSPEAKRKVAGITAGIITFFIFAGWFVHYMGLFATAYNATKKQGIAIFSFFDQNVEKAYNGAQQVLAENSASTTSTGIFASSTINALIATSTATTTATTTINN